MSNNKYTRAFHFQSGIWFTNNNTDISYPKDGNESCFVIEDNSYWFKHRNNCLTTLIKKYSPPKNTIFDVGGGNGFVSKRLQDEGFTVYLIEPGLSGILNAQKRGVKNLINSTLETNSFENNTIPAIGIFDVLEHIENDSAFLKLLFSKLQNEGILYIAVPAYNSLWTKEDDLAGHYRRYTLNQLRKLLNNSGFKILYKTYFFSLLPIPILIFRKLLGKFYSKKDILQKTKNEHTVSNSVLSKFMKLLWRLELFLLKKQFIIPFGSSCVIVATKQEK